LVVFMVRRSQAETSRRLPPRRPAEGPPWADALHALIKAIERVGIHRDVMQVFDRLTLRPDSRANIRSEKRRGHESVSAQGPANPSEPFARPRHKPVADSQVERVIEVVVDISQKNRVVESRR